MSSSRFEAVLTGKTISGATFFNGSLAADDVQATYEQLKAKGVEFVSPAAKQPWGEFAVFKGS